MGKKFLLLLSVLVIVPILAAGAVQQQVTPTPDMTPTPDVAIERDVTVIALEEQEGSGFAGIAILWERDQRTMVVAGIVPTMGLATAPTTDEEVVGEAAIYTGTCTQPDEQVMSLGRMQPIQNTNAFAVNAMIDISLQEIFAEDHILVVTERDEDVLPGVTPEIDITPTPGVNGLQQPQEELSLLACGELVEEEPTLMPTPEATPQETPIVPSP